MMEPMKKSVFNAYLVALLGMVLLLLMPAAAWAADKIMFSYLYAWEGNGKAAMTSNFKSQINAAGNIDVVSPNYFYIQNAEGQVKDLADPELIMWAQLQGIKVVPMLKNDGLANDYIKLLLGDARKRSKLVADLVALVQNYKLDGLNIDIEGVGNWNNDRDLTLFTQELSAELRKIKKISSIAVFAKYGDNDPAWHSEYDYKAMGAAVDWLVIMAYDEHWAGGQPGPVASLGWVDKILKYAVTAVSKEKILLGMPLYGYHWVKAPGADKFAKGSSVTYAKAREIAGNANMTLGWDAEAGSPYLKFTDSAGTHELWFEDEQSLGLKMDLMNKYDLGGAAIWRLGLEPAGWWKMMGDKLAGTARATDPGKSSPPKSTLPEPSQPPQEPQKPQEPPQENPQPPAQPGPGSSNLKDVEKHWARKEITALVQKGVLKGMGENTFGPELKVTRAQLAVMLVRATGLTLSGTTSEFRDVPAGYWANKEIAAARKAGIISGDPGGTFRPDSPASRAEIAKMIAVAFKLEVKGSPSAFKDVKAGHWAYEYVLALKSNGVTTGYEDGTFKPKNNTTRAETAAFIYRSMAAKGIDLPKPTSAAKGKTS